MICSHRFPAPLLHCSPPRPLSPGLHAGVQAGQAYLCLTVCWSSIWNSLPSKICLSPPSLPPIFAQMPFQWGSLWISNLQGILCPPAPAIPLHLPCFNFLSTYKAHCMSLFCLTLHLPSHWQAYSGVWDFWLVSALSYLYFGSQQKMITCWMSEPVMSIGVCCPYKLWDHCNVETSLFISPPQTPLDDQGLAPRRISKQWEDHWTWNHCISRSFGI